MLGIVDDAAHRSEDRGEGGDAGQDQRGSGWEFRADYKPSGRHAKRAFVECDAQFAISAMDYAPGKPRRESWVSNQEEHGWSEVRRFRREEKFALAGRHER